MKLALMSLGILAVVAGTASASLFSPSARNASAAAIPLPTPVAPAVAPTAPAPDLDRTPTPLFQVKGEPVPAIHLAKHMPYVPPPADQPPDTQQQATAPEAPKLGEDAARAAITTDGYRGIRSITRTADGTWAARVMRGSTEIGVTVSADGRVSAD